MERTNFKKADLILTGDWHLREDAPTCRTDDFEKTQWMKLKFISELQQKHGCAVFCSGDVFHHWKGSPEFLSKVSIHIPDAFVAVYGNHDLPQHNLLLAEKSCLYNLLVNDKVTILKEGHWGWKPNGDARLVIKGRKVIMWHVMTYQGKEPYPGCADLKAGALLRKYPQYDLILTGDNHKSFVEEYQGRLLVNPGSLMRQTADQIDHRPAVWLWYAETNTVTPVYLPIEKDVISREHLDVKHQRDERIDAFINSLNNEWEGGLSFEDNLELFEKENKVRKSVMDIVYKTLE